LRRLEIATCSHESGDEEHFDLCNGSALRLRLAPARRRQMARIHRWPHQGIRYFFVEIATKQGMVGRISASPG
jgi:hypothetical protein